MVVLYGGTIKRFIFLYMKGTRKVLKVLRWETTIVRFAFENIT